MEIISPIHGKMEYNESEILTFEKGIPGFQDLKKFIIKEVSSESPFSVMQSIEDKYIGFIIISPFLIDDKYEIKLSDEIIKSLDIENSEDVLLYTIVTLKEKIEHITTNLKAPIVINTKKNKCEQYILDSEKYKIREKVLNKVNDLK